MKEIINIIINNRMVLATMFFLIYWFFLISNLTFSIPVHENNHWIDFLNNVSEKSYWIEYLYSWIKWNIIGLDYGYISNIFFSFLMKSTYLDYSIVFKINILFHLLSAIIFWLVLKKIFSKSEFYYFWLFVYAFTPILIRFSNTESLFVIWNFFILTSIYALLIYLENRKILYILLFYIFFLFSIYTRNLYLLYLPIVLFLIYFQNNIWWSKFKINITKNKHKVLGHIFLLASFLVIIFSRLNAFLNQEKTHTNIDSYGTTIYNSYTAIIENSNNFLMYLLPSPYLIFMLITLLLLCKNRNFISKYLLCFIIYIYWILILYIINQWPYLFIERIFLPFIPLYLVLVVIGVYLIWKNFKGNSVKIFLLFFIAYIPILKIDFTQRLYNPQMEFNFLKENIKNIKNHSNLIILWAPNDIIHSTFPKFLLKNSNISYYALSHYDVSYENFYLNKKILEQNINNYFYLWVDCYRFNKKSNDINSYIRKECWDFIKEYNLLKIHEEYIDNKKYIIWNTVNSEKIKIWLYKINSIR